MFQIIKSDNDYYILKDNMFFGPYCSVAEAEICKDLKLSKHFPYIYKIVKNC